MTLPPGRLKLATSPSWTGSLPLVKTIGIVVVEVFAARLAGVLVAAMTETLAANQVVGQCSQAIELSVRPAIFDRYILAFDIAGFLQTLTECVHLGRVAVRRCAIEKSDHRERLLLRTHREWPCRHHTAEKRDEIASLHVPPREDHVLCREILRFSGKPP